jgi:peptidoglycan/LPS O-acetylase OafA/YrhL
MRNNRIAFGWGLTIVLVLLCLLYIFQKIPSLINWEQIGPDNYDSNFFFTVMLLGLLLLLYIKRRKRVRLILSLSLGLLSYICWFSFNADWWAEYNIDLHEQKFLAIIFLGIGFWVLVSKSLEEKRRNFSEVVRREAIQKQKGRCKRCKRKLEAYGIDLDHKNGDRSNNKPSNCQVLCVPCHRRKHAQ